MCCARPPKLSCFYTVLQMTAGAHGVAGDSPGDPFAHEHARLQPCLPNDRVCGSSTLPKPSSCKNGNQKTEAELPRAIQHVHGAPLDAGPWRSLTWGPPPEDKRCWFDSQATR